ncbi:FG-GAP-like repeat-containing protein [Chryseosolibacter indicus]|uniref:Tetratricopeptide repeat protein n=1 Tax=Chryseosolibacter indicus TaxID=2782351 RepID=A0ABS5VPE1_9BACT|nr:FG-GAP-like repeat-containing protein [Chryseosolibacter indicus]MBT1703315.1 tetratricopeptide repeat protein [Chryseosolibacter indicus]
MKTKFITFLALAGIVLVLNTCSRYDNHQQMLELLAKAKKAGTDPGNMFNPSSKLVYMDSLLSLPHNTSSQISYCKYLKAQILMELGREDDAIELYEEVLQLANPLQKDLINRELAIAYLRKGERSNCISDHAAESCLIPIRGLGLHRDTVGSVKAIEHYMQMLDKNPADLESKWLLNIAFMTLGKYPAEVPDKYFLPAFDEDTTVRINAFQDIAGSLGIAVNNMAGGTIVDDFDNDGYLDLVNSSMDLEEPMHFFKNNADGTFTDMSVKSGLANFHGGLNMVQADYDNDGDKDILVLRGAWKEKFGNEPNSLLQNQGNGTFRDVTLISGMLSYHPTQTATWNDFNNDGWLDVFIGNESTPDNRHPCELYINNTDGTFRNIAFSANCDYTLYVKGVTSGDYDNDGWKDIFISTTSGQRLLLKNLGISKQEIAFQDVTAKAGLAKEKGNSFPTWFWDYNNDGWLDIFVCDYTFQRTLAYYAAAEKLSIPAGNPDKAMLYHNNKNGTFTNVASEVGLNKVIFAMGSNFGDIDNDGFLDMYLGTGNPPYQSIVPNKMFKNIKGEKFADVTSAAKVGHLQKGHGVAFADMDNDGDQDIYIDMGGAYPGDAYQNAFFVNPGQGNNNWITIDLRGTKSNTDAIGTRIKISFTENGVQRSVYRDVNSGGSFGASPLRREIGVGRANIIDDLEIHWHGSGITQRFRNVPINQFIRITEGSELIQNVPLKTFVWSVNDPLCISENYASKNMKIEF